MRISSPDPIPRAERDFLLQHTDATETDFAPERLRENRVEVMASTELLDAQAIESALTTKEVAKRLGVSDGAIRQRLKQGKLYAAGTDSSGRQHLFPMWQFSDQGLFPTLRRSSAPFRTTTTRQMSNTS
ncbi:helix-turn-helix domain-containing protein [Nesterenkonia pannonica]|uniref:helix-turn-helix domain-containing protein n=1 Tax=Nesterenkonia pannonica TaxID=1548602 RepID=UPI002164C44F|nr:helix-turn-helix domain-containing protein [Nesterenkonia pannonica]